MVHKGDIKIVSKMLKFRRNGKVEFAPLVLTLLLIILLKN